MPVQIVLDFSRYFQYFNMYLQGLLNFHCFWISFLSRDFKESNLELLDILCCFCMLLLAFFFFFLFLRKIAFFLRCSFCLQLKCRFHRRGLCRFLSFIKKKKLLVGCWICRNKLSRDYLKYVLCFSDLLLGQNFRFFLRTFPNI